jgi:hypothetical protein
MSALVGSAGEHLVQARLLVRGWIAGNANSGGVMNAPAVDIMAAKGSKNIRIAVKTTGHGSQNAQWSVIKNRKTLFKGDVRPDFVIFVWFTSRQKPDECRIFIVPAKVVDRVLYRCHVHWHKHLRRDGRPRANSNHAAFSWTGKPTEGNIALWVCQEVETIRR